jgi:Ser/Thr protein kinase RdoA (MazF antagonist)
MSLVQHAPSFDLEQATTIAKDIYGVSGVIKELPSERDQNFLLTAESGHRFVLKIANSLEQHALLEAQNEAMSHLQTRVDFCPRVVKTQSGESIIQISTKTTPHYVRLVTFIDGLPLANVNQSPDVLFDLGKKLGQLTRALSDFDHEAFHRDFHWDLANGLKVIREYELLVTDAALRLQLNSCVQQFENVVLPRLPRLRRSIIHGDANNHNVVVDGERITGIIDFGDMVQSYTVGELAIALAYVVLGNSDPLACVKYVVGAYVREWMLTEDELESLWTLMLMRLCMSVCLAAFQQMQKPANQYLDISQESIRQSLRLLLEIDPGQAARVFSA